MPKIPQVLMDMVTEIEHEAMAVVFAPLVYAARKFGRPIKITIEPRDDRVDFNLEMALPNGEGVPIRFWEGIEFKPIRTSQLGEEPVQYERGFSVVYPRFVRDMMQRFYEWAQHMDLPPPGVQKTEVRA